MSKSSKSTARKRVEARFFTASSGPDPTEQQKLDVAKLRELIVDLGTAIEDRIPDGRNKSLALTALEDVQMRANRAIFAPAEPRAGGIVGGGLGGSSINSINIAPGIGPSMGGVALALQNQMQQRYLA